MARLFFLCLLLIGGQKSALAQFDLPSGFGSLGGNNAPKVTLDAEFTTATADRPALLFVSAKMAEGFHVYAIDQGALPKGGGPMATKISLKPGAKARVVGRWQPLKAPHTHIDQEIWTGLEMREHDGRVTWVVPIEFTAGAAPSTLTVSGTVEGQACNPQTCIPFEQPFTASLGTGVALPKSFDLSTTKLPTADSPTPPPIQPSQTLQPSNLKTTLPKTTIQKNAIPSSTTETTYDLSQISVEESESQSLVYYLITAFLGGIVLNIMPCVLPVIGLKVMSFVQQAGTSRAHAWMLNCWYAAGIIFVFLVLASLAVSVQLGWGGQFGSAKFNITLIAIVFAMALSMLGLWEIPIPGFVGSGTAMNMAEKEGPAAAFLKGVLTTVLATPCTGPFMATALAWAVRQPAWVTYSVFGVLGLGMASPYLLIGAFPSLIKFLPKPGAWMETFKKVMGIVLLATVVWLMTFIDAALAVPTVAMMVGIAAACWWISQTPITASFGAKLHSWTVAGLVTAIVVMGSYGWLYKHVMLPRFEKNVAARAEQQISLERIKIAQELGKVQEPGQLEAVIESLVEDVADEGDQPWQRFTLAKLGRKTLGEGRTVLVDFTADWCLTCKTLEKLVLKTRPVEDAIAQADVITMEADYTKKPESIDRAIKALGGVGVPLIAIFPANDPYNPIVFSDGNYTKAGLIEAISQATGKEIASSNGATSNNYGSSKTSLIQASGEKPRL